MTVDLTPDEVEIIKTYLQFGIGYRCDQLQKLRELEYLWNDPDEETRERIKYLESGITEIDHILRKLWEAQK